MIAITRLRGLLLCCSLVPGCVVSTHEGVGVAPSIPLPEERAASENRAAELSRGPTEIAASHILISYQGAMRAAPYVQRSKEEASSLAQELRSRALKGEDFAGLAGEFSDDRGSAAQGGSLGKFRREQMVPEFSNAAFSLEVGDVSEVVESPFGFHVIKRDP
ncbi:MAG TPA: peptidylprolyl isomerase [Polyangiaceae bacterium]|nr:peptidylprolyl isomerase [Polyangiaceae bacterium]